jgi:hypothetical protein
LSNRGSFVTLILGVCISAAVAAAVAALPVSRAAGQATEMKPATQEKQPAAKAGDKSKDAKDQAKDAKPVAFTPAEVIVETAILFHGGRTALKNVRGAIREEGTIRLATDDGEISGSYLLRSIRKEKSWEDLLRTDLELNIPESLRRATTPATTKYVVAFNGASVWAARNGQYITPPPQTEIAFRAQLTHDYQTLFRYKEDGSKVELIGPETVVGLDTNVIEMTTPNGEKTRYWVSTKTYRILHIEYELKLPDVEKATKFRISYFPPVKVVQNTVVLGRRVTTQDGKFAQEVTLTNLTYTAKLNPEIFQYLQNE